ncbi:MAG: RibD family protein [Alphaproteobacteria bacterium]
MLRSGPEALAAAAPLDEDAAWAALRALAEGSPPPDRLTVDACGRWTCAGDATTAAGDLLDLYAAFVAERGDGRPSVFAHLGQSLDGRIATESGESAYITCPANLDHMHRMRALADAVVVGAGTVRHDNPRLTVRRVPGAHPLRVVIDTERRLDDHYGLFRDGAAPTLLVCAADRRDRAHLGEAEVAAVGRRGETIDYGAVIALLSARGCRRIFVEGGGITVSRFLAQNCLDRLHVAVAPVILGSGRPAIQLPPLAALAEARRPPTRIFRMGADVLFDCDLGADG